MSIFSVDWMMTGAYHSRLPMKLWSLFESVDHGFVPRSCSGFLCGSGTLYSCNLRHFIHLLLSHLPVADYMVLGPKRLFNDTSRRIYNEIYLAPWWWETQDLVPGGETLVRLLLASDKTHLPNFVGDKAAWPVNMSISNLSKDLQL